MRHVLCLSLLIGLTLSGVARAAIVGQPVDYRAGETTLKGFLAFDDQRSGQRPGVLVVHEWWGHNDYARERARQLARLGYVALAIDMYGEGKQAAHPAEAGKFSAALMAKLPLAEERFQAAYALLVQHPRVDGTRIAAIGYCFGGGVVLHMARTGLELRGVASFHGSLGALRAAEPGKVKAKVLVCTGADDPFVGADEVAKFEQEMKAARVDYKLIRYRGAKHSFTNPAADALGKQFNLPLVYNAKADKASWAALKHFLRRVFR
ncbi:MAG: dienelactone hydrolase family protein [Proteobacteria bacterium]|nr:dienelactone hydrolase family protein [Pseudomonadota bacterium]